MPDAIVPAYARRAGAAPGTLNQASVERIFIYYHQNDATLCSGLLNQVAPFAGSLSWWSPADIIEGAIAEQRTEALRRSTLILLLVSIDLVNEEKGELLKQIP